jgi:hypothetical protein
MNIKLDVMQRMLRLRVTQPDLRLYALVDGVQYVECQGQPLRAGEGLFPLFTGTPDAAHAHAGPWLVDCEQIEQVAPALMAELTQLEQKAPAIIWLITPSKLEDLAALLQPKLNIRLPDGRAALLRFWDPRVSAGLAQRLDAAQRKEFFGDVDEWHWLREGQRVCIKNRGQAYVDTH